LMHPRTRKNMDKFGLWNTLHANINVIETVKYIEMLKLISESKFVITDSGGLQEEACILGTPCYTLRNSTERPETVECGANTILGVDHPADAFVECHMQSNNTWTSPYGDGTTANKIVVNSIKYLEKAYKK